MEENPAGLAVACAGAKGHHPSSLVGLFEMGFLEAYKYLSKCSKLSDQSPVSGRFLLLQFVEPVKGILEKFKWEITDLVGDAKEDIEAHEKKVRSLRCSLLFANWCIKVEKVQYILNRIGDLSFICWPNKMDEKMEKDTIFMISDLQRKVMPSVPEARIALLEVFLEVFKASKSSRSGASLTVEGVVSSLPNFLLSLHWQFHRIKLVKIEAKAIWLQAGGISLFNLPTSDIVGFINDVTGDIEIIERRIIIKQLEHHCNEILSIIGMTGFGNIGICLGLERQGRLGK